MLAGNNKKSLIYKKPVYTKKNDTMKMITPKTKAKQR